MTEKRLAFKSRCLNKHKYRLKPVLPGESSPELPTRQAEASRERLVCGGSPAGGTLHRQAEGSSRIESEFSGGENS